MQIAIDTSTDVATVALVEGKVILAELTWLSQRNHSVELLPNLIHLLRQAGRELGSATAIIVARGPGSYNGLRVGVSAAKGLAFSLDIPLVGVSTLAVTAYPHLAWGLPVCPVNPAGRGEVATARYQVVEGGWRTLEKESLSTVSILCAGTKTRTVFCGELTPEVIREIEQSLEDLAVLPSPAARLRRAVFLAELGLDRLAAGEVDSVATLQPIYLRRPAITQSKHR